MNDLSERVQREFKEWQNKYVIPYEKEFQVKTLLKLQEEYDNTEVSSKTTMTRNTLLRMIDEVQKQLVLKEKLVPIQESPLKGKYHEYRNKFMNMPHDELVNQALLSLGFRIE